MNPAPGSTSHLMSQFHLGVSPDGQECLMVFVDDEQNAMKCVARFPEFRAFVANLCEIANEMARRQTKVEASAALPWQMVEVSAGTFRSEEGEITGALIDTNGELFPVRMTPDVAAQLCRSLLMASPAVLAS